MNRRTAAAMVLAFLVPGAGHLYLGRTARGVAFFCIIASLFVYGLCIDGRLYSVQQGNVLSLLATLGSIGSGLLYFIGRMYGPPGDITSLTFEYGTAFTLTAGLMNLLLVVDSFDIAEGRKE
jgi:TM2 domain-containing membrane protein YozV